MNLFRKFWRRPAEPSLRTIAFDEMQAAGGFGESVNRGWDGSQFIGGLGGTQIIQPNYWELRKRSNQLYNSNLYARGLIRRLVTNEINTGLSPEASPVESVLGKTTKFLEAWADTVEDRFGLWWKNPQLCDVRGQRTFAGIQQDIRAEAIIGGDVLVVLRQSSATRLPMVEVIQGDLVRNPMSVFNGGKTKSGNIVKEGVELDSHGRQVAYWVKGKRLPAFGSRSGRRLAWLVYGTDKRHSEVRGQPLLSLVMQSINEIGRYRDSVQRKAWINSILAIWIKKTKGLVGSLPFTKAAADATTTAVPGSDGVTRNFNITKAVPGMVVEELQEGEEPVGFNSQGIDLSFGPFEASILQGIAWANEVPPEILMLAFSNNYSASQAAINEFKIYLNKIRTRFGEEVCQPIYTEWLLAENLLGKIESPGLLQAWRDPRQYDIFTAWVMAEWSGAIKPSTDILKQAKGYAAMLAMGGITHARMARELTGTSFRHNIATVKRENQQIAEAMAPLQVLAGSEDTSGTTPEDLEDVALELIEGGAGG